METNTVQKEWLSYSEAQQYVGIGRTKLTELIRSGEIPAAKIGRAVRISRRGLAQYMELKNFASAAK